MPSLITSSVAKKLGMALTGLLLYGCSLIYGFTGSTNFNVIAAQLNSNEYTLTFGIVLTGGSSKMEGAIELAEEIFHMPVRLGVPQHVTGLAENVKNPIYATAVGLLLYGQKQERDEMTRIDMNNGVKSFWVRIKSWFQGHF